MNILHLEASTGFGGQEMRILKESLGMRERGHFVLFATSPNAELAKKAREEGFQVFELPFKKLYWPLSFFYLLLICLKFKIEIINTHSSLDSWLGGFVGRALRKKVVRTRHLSTKVKKGLNSRLLYGYLADFVVTTCQRIVPVLSEQSKKPLSLLKSIATGVDPEKIVSAPTKVEAFRKKLSLQKEDILVGTLCVMRSWKGIGDLLEAAYLLRDEPNLRWVIIGGGHDEVHKKRAKELALEGIVHFVGHIDAPYSEMKALDIFTLLSTDHEGVSQAALQAAYLKKPLITTETGGLNEVCLDGKTGLIVPKFSPKEVARAVLKLKNDKELRESFGENAHLHVVQNFTMGKTLSEMEEVYQIVHSR